MKTRWRILVAAGNSYGDSLAARLRGDGHTVDIARSRSEALSLAGESEYSAYIVGQELLDTDGSETIAEIRRLRPEASVIVTAHGQGMNEADFASLAHRTLGTISEPPGLMSLEAMERALVRATLELTSGNIRESASILGIDRSTIYEKIKKYEIPRPRRKGLQG
jgi:DNA-binding NtrC family response regulator